MFQIQNICTLVQVTLMDEPGYSYSWSLPSLAMLIQPKFKDLQAQATIAKLLHWVYKFSMLHGKTPLRIIKVGHLPILLKMLQWPAVHADRTINQRRNLADWCRNTQTFTKYNYHVYIHHYNWAGTTVFPWIYALALWCRRGCCLNEASVTADTILKIQSPWDHNHSL